MNIRFLGLCLAVGALVGVLITVPRHYVKAASTQQIEAAVNTNTCETTETEFSTCSLSVTWPTAFADTNYDYVCVPQNGVESGQDSNGGPDVIFFANPSSKTTTSASFTIQNELGNIDHGFLNGASCIAVHN